MIDKIFSFFLGSKHERDLKELLPILQKINEKETWAMGLASEDFPSQTEKFKERLANGEALDDLLPEAFALAREAARRTLGERPYDVQLLGALALHQGRIMEMKTGEGKTLSSVPAAYTNALTGKGVHVVTVNDYLAERDAKWMEPVFGFMGISVGSILSNMDNDARKIAYNKDITYGTNNEFGFDYLRDNMSPEARMKVQRPHNYCIIDEIDSILIDESRTPLIISGAAQDDTGKFRAVNNIVHHLKECDKDPETGEYPEEPVGDFKIDEKGKRVLFTDEGMNHIESLLVKKNVISGSLFDEHNFEYTHYVTQALKAHKLFQIDVDYVVQDGTVQIVDEFTGRILHGRRYSDGLHQAIEAKEGIKVAQRNKTLATITFQNYFRMYEKISGMTGTADTEAKEFAKIYNLDVVVIPTNRPVARIDEDDVIYFNEKFKFEAICDDIKDAYEKGQPVLAGTVSIEKSELLSSMLTKKGVRHEILNAKNHHREALIIAEAGAKGSVTIATNMAGRGTDIKLGGNPEFRALRKCGTDASDDVKKAAVKEERKLWQKDYEEVKELGGLFVIGTERHESRRIDNQLRGRSGRQGDPGRSKFYVSLDDDLMRLFAKDGIKDLMGKMGMSSGEPIYHPWINKSLENAQKKVEDRNFEVRKHLLDYDDVLNEQRTFIYDQRDAILTDDDLINRIISTKEELVSDIVGNFKSEKGGNPEGSYVALLDDLKQNFFYEPPISLAELKSKNDEEIEAYILEELTKDLKEKESLVGKENLNLFIRDNYLRYIDIKWQEHLENLEALREAVYLRSYAQKNPLLEYKLEGFQIFDKLIYDIRATIAKMLLKVKVRRADERRRPTRQNDNVSMNHQELGQFGGGAPLGGPRRRPQQQASAPEKVQVVRTGPKVGRNDPCPCGSGKKYKKCCGAQ